jgi:trans-aconitate methyltransferase
MPQDFVDPSVSIADIGCGNGAFTMEIASRFRPRAGRGIDPAENAIGATQVLLRALLGAPLRLETRNIYDVTSE